MSGITSDQPINTVSTPPNGNEINLIENAIVTHLERNERSKVCMQNKRKDLRDKQFHNYNFSMPSQADIDLKFIILFYKSITGDRFTISEVMEMCLAHVKRDLQITKPIGKQQRTKPVTMRKLRKKEKFKKMQIKKASYRISDAQNQISLF